MSARWMLYSYDALGLGHVRRMLGIARAVLADRPDVAALLATCSPQIDALPVPPGLDYIKLPSARKLDNDRYVPRTLAVDAGRLCAMRMGMLLDAVRCFEPDLFLVDKAPLGLMGELGPSLEQLRRRRPGARVALGWRDILDAPRRVRAEWRKRGTIDVLDRYYDEIWVYGDPAVFDVREAYPLPPHLAERIRYLGYLAPRIDEAERDALRAERCVSDGPLAVVTAGGGEDGRPLLTCFLEAMRRQLLPRGLRALVVTGPFMPESAQCALEREAPAGVTVIRFVRGLDRLVAAADVVVCMAGYNTVCEAMGAGTPAVLVPRIGHREEQRMRTARLAALGVVEHVMPKRLEAAALSAAIGRALQRPRGTPERPRLGGLERAMHEVRRLLPDGWARTDSARPTGAAAVSNGEVRT